MDRDFQLRIALEAKKQIDPNYPVDLNYPHLTLGKTSRHLLIRSREHLGIGKKGQPIKTSPSAISEHIKQTGHCANLENFTILEKAKNEYDLLIFESLLILRDRQSLSAQNSSIPLVLF